MKPGDRILSYEVLRRIGEGAFAEIWLARRPSDRHEVAIKLLRGDKRTDPRALQALLNEARRAATQLRHPNIVAIEECDEHSRAIVMEHVDGVDLGRVLDRRSLDRPALLAVGSQVARGLEASHSVSVLHLDLKPANLLLTRTGVVKVADFGAHMMGTYAYMPPEQAGGAPLDARADVYALAATLYHLATGRRLQVAASVDDLRKAQQARGRELPLADQLGEDLARVLRRALEPRPEDRYPAVSDLRRDLEALPDLPRDLFSELAAICKQTIQAERRGRFLGAEPSAPARGADETEYNKQPPGRRLLPYAAAFLLVALAAAAAAFLLRNRDVTLIVTTTNVVGAEVHVRRGAQEFGPPVVRERDLVFRGLEPGLYDVTVKKEGYREVTLSRILSAGEVPMPVQLEQLREKPAISPPAATPAGTPVPSPSPAADGPPVATVSFIATSKAPPRRIYLDGNEVGTFPGLVQTRVAPGRHLVRWVADQGETTEETVEVSAPHTRTLHLVKAVGSLQVTLNPHGTLRIDGREMTWAGTIQVDANYWHRVEAIFPGGATRERPVRVAPGQTVEVVFDLEAQ